MRIKVLLFGPQAQLAGTREVTLDITESDSTCAQARQLLGQMHPELADSLPASRIAVNHQFVSDDYQLQPSDEVALIGMVSGG